MDPGVPVYVCLPVCAGWWPWCPSVPNPRSHLACSHFIEGWPQQGLGPTYKMSDWTCAQCAFRNIGAVSQCDLCDVPRPTAGSPPRRLASQSSSPRLASQSSSARAAAVARSPLGLLGLQPIVAQPSPPSKAPSAGVSLAFARSPPAAQPRAAAPLATAPDSSAIVTSDPAIPYATIAYCEAAASSGAATGSISAPMPTAAGASQLPTAAAAAVPPPPLAAAAEPPPPATAVRRPLLPATATARSDPPPSRTPPPSRAPPLPRAPPPQRPTTRSQAASSRGARRQSLPTAPSSAATACARSNGARSTPR